jgi:hypothetical protein
MDKDEHLTVAAPYMTEALRKKCVYCLQNNELRKDQILLRGGGFYLCAPRGQIVEGYLVIAPYSCIGCLSRLPSNYFLELDWIMGVVTDFYKEVYQMTHATVYEQGRAGGGAVIDAAGGFPHHAHLCFLPLSIDLHTPLASQYVQRSLSGLHELPIVAGNRPYLYVECTYDEGDLEKCLYVARSDDGRRELENKRLKSTIATLMGLPERGNWREYPGDRELDRVIQHFAAFRQGRGAMRKR